MRFPLLIAAVLLVVCFPHRTTAQTPCPPAGIETDPAHATNPTPGGTVNTFNWYYGDYMPSTYAGTLYKLNSVVDAVPYIELPWQQANNINTVRFQGKNDIAINGWELIRRDLGYNDAGNPLATSTPFVILYNKYLGMLRVFVTVQRPLTNFQFAEIKLGFSPAANSKSATLNRASSLGVALEDTEKGLTSEFAVVSRYLNDGRKWFVADFPMEYDPCICQFDSRLQIQVNLIKQASVTLQSVSNGTIVTSQDATNGTNSGPSFFKKINGSINAAGTSYDNVDKLVSILRTADPGNKSASAITAFASTLKDNKFLQTGLSGVPYIGAAVGLLDFFTGGGQDSAPQPLALQPLAIQMTTNTTGTIKDTSTYVTPYFLNPGNRIANTLPSDIPNYNEAMGVFSLLQRPPVDFTSKTVITGTTRTNMVRTTTLNFRLTNDLAYVLNPASGLQVQDFQVALMGEATSPTSSPQAPTGGSFTTLEGNILESDGTIHQLYRTPYYDAACIKNQNFSWQSVYQNSAVDVTTPSKLFIKVMLNLKPSRGSSTQQNVLYVSRYPANFNSVSAFSSLPQVVCGVLPQASASAIQAVCSGGKYTYAVALPRASKYTAGSLIGQAPVRAQSVIAYPNPATSSVHFNFTTTQAGHIHAFLSDALGREVLQVLETDQKSAGTIETNASIAGLRSGIYYCTLQTSNERVVQKLVVTQ